MLLFVYKLNKKILLLTIAIILAISLALIGIVFPNNVESLSPLAKYTVVLDAGHGGIDVGATGVNGTKESDLNLKYAFCLDYLLTSFGFNVVQTRTTQDGLYTSLKSGFKMEDMNKRKEIINSSNADLVISIHMNKYPASSSKGAQVFYQSNSEQSEALANAIQSMLYLNVENARLSTQSGDFYICRCSSITSVIIECGFLSNPLEEANLINNSYMNNFCYTVLCGILKYFKFQGVD